MLALVVWELAIKRQLDAVFLEQNTPRSHRSWSARSEMMAAQTVTMPQRPNTDIVKSSIVKGHLGAPRFGSRSQDHAACLNHPPFPTRDELPARMVQNLLSDVSSDSEVRAGGCLVDLLSDVSRDAKAATVPRRSAHSVLGKVGGWTKVGGNLCSMSRPSCRCSTGLGGDATWSTTAPA